MVHTALWQQSGLTGVPCILCFEKAIGRTLKQEDLKPNLPCNISLDPIWFNDSKRTPGTLPIEYIQKDNIIQAESVFYYQQYGMQTIPKNQNNY